jgi:epoxyqueuosine reductase
VYVRHVDVAAIRALFAAHGVEAVGIAAATPLPEDAARYRARLAAGYAAGMSYLHRHAEQKFDPDRILPGCRSIIVAALGYLQETPPAARRQGSEPMGRVARYAWGRDYHEVLGGRLTSIARELERLMPGERFHPTTDATPLAETRYAERAGLGHVGRNGLLIHSRLGSWIVLGEILTTAELPPTPHADGVPQCPPSCRQCLDVCPTKALVAPGVLDARLCISYHTIENRAEIPAELRPALGDHVLGCDDCQDVCPLNHGAPTTTVPEFLNHRAGPEVGLSRLLALRSRSQVERLFRGSAMTRPGRAGLVRNAAVAAANLGAANLVPQLERLRSDPDERVAEHAKWAVERLTGEGSRSPPA